MYMNILTLPVSLGEALDKLTILDIKLNKIKDDRSKDVEKEYNILQEKLCKYQKKYEFYYDILKQINLDIWEMQDKFRDNEGDKTKLCLQIIKDNDRRFRVKKKINNLTNSALKEQKGYKPQKAFVLTHLGLGDNITAIGMVRYLSTCYDEIIVVSFTKNKENLELFYQDDKSITIMGVGEENSISPRRGFPRKKFDKITEGYDLYITGCHNWTKPENRTISIPFRWYDHANIDPKYFWSYFYIPDTDLSKKLFDKIKTIKYIFAHSETSGGRCYNSNYISNKFKELNKDEILFLNPCENFYKEEHPFYKLANEFVGHRLIHYKDTIINSYYNFFTDSSFCCMALNLEIKSDNNFICSTRNRYTLYDEKYIFKHKKKKIFKIF